MPPILLEKQYGNFLAAAFFVLTIEAPCTLSSKTSLFGVYMVAGSAAEPLKESMSSEMNTMYQCWHDDILEMLLYPLTSNTKENRMYKNPPSLCTNNSEEYRPAVFWEV